MSKVGAEQLPWLVVGAGFSGAVIARELGEKTGGRVVVVDRRSHIAGNCHTERDKATGIMIHRYGPHIFNTDDRQVWEYVNRFGVFRPYVNRVKAVTSKGVFSFPVNLHTLNQFFDRLMTPVQAQEFVNGLGDPRIGIPANFEEQALKMLGRELYEAFFYGYTKKQWGCEPRQLPADVLKRLPVRFDYNDSYYDKAWQGIPEEGYTSVIGNVLRHPAIEIRTGVDFRELDRGSFKHIVYTGPVDEYFGFAEGRLGYRTVAFERIDAEGDYQGNAVLNYPDLVVPWTRIHEHKHFAPWEKHAQTVAFREFSRETGLTDEPYYPKRLPEDLSVLRKYEKRAGMEPGVTFAGRLATYRYLNMDQVIREALDLVVRLVGPEIRR